MSTSGRPAKELDRDSLYLHVQTMTNEMANTAWGEDVDASLAALLEQAEKMAVALKATIKARNL